MATRYLGYTSPLGYFSRINWQVTAYPLSTGKPLIRRHVHNNVVEMSIGSRLSSDGHFVGHVPVQSGFTVAGSFALVLWVHGRTVPFKLSFP